MKNHNTISEKEAIALYNALLDIKGTNQEHLTSEQMQGFKTGVSMAMAMLAYKLLGKVIIDHVKL